VERVLTALADAGATGEVRTLSDSARTASDAAAALGCDVGAIASSLVFQADGDPVLVLTSGAHRVDTGKVAALLDVDAVERAPASVVKEATGHAHAVFPTTFDELVRLTGGTPAAVGA
jgi:prolyl-tRNA editing enzyme YbaK/EbsC (Cys-tRNA(Pro) deacylase)